MLSLKKTLAAFLAASTAFSLMSAAAFADAEFTETRLLDAPAQESDNTGFWIEYITPEEYNNICSTVDKDFGYSPSTPKLPQMLPGKNFSSSFFYDQLNSAKKAFYNGLDAVCAEFANDFSTNLSTIAFNKGVSFNGGSMNTDEAYAVYQLFYYDHPQYYFLSSGCKLSSMGGEYNFLPCVIDSFKSAGARAKYDALIDDAAKKILEGAESLGAVSQTERQMYITKALADLVTYKKTDLDQSIAGAFGDKKCVCNGYTLAMTYLLNAVGIETIGIRNQSHAWNAVKINGDWFLTDSTWVDQKENNSGFYNWDWFNKSSATFIQNDSNYWHSADNSTYTSAGVQLPGCLYDMTVGADGRLVTDAQGNPILSDKKNNPPAAESGTMYADKTKAKVINEVTVWCNGGTVKQADGTKLNYKSATCFADIQLESVKVKDVPKTGKLIAVVTSTTDIPKYANGKFDKDAAAAAIATAAVKTDGTVTISGGKSAGKAYVWVFDQKADKTLGAYARVGVTVKGAAKKVTFEDSKGEAIKGASVTVGESTSFKIIGTVDGKAEIATESTYSVELDKKAEGCVTATVSGTTVNVNTTGFGTAKPGKPLDTKVNIVCNESGKKTAFSLTIVNPVSGIKTAVSSGTKLAAPKDTVVLTVTETGKISGQTITSSAKVYVCTTKPYVDAKTGKVSTTTHTAKYKDGTLTLTCKYPGEAKVYMAYTNGKETSMFLAASIAEDGTVTCV